MMMMVISFLHHLSLHPHHLPQIMALMMQRLLNTICMLSSSPSYTLSSEDANQAIQYLESSINIQLKQHVKEIVIEAYNIHYKENRGITRQDIVERFKYSNSYAKKILYECQHRKVLVHLKGHKQGRFKEYFIATEIETFLQKQDNVKSGMKQGIGVTRQIDTSCMSIIQMLINEITARKPTFHKLMIHVKLGVPDPAIKFDQDYNLLTEKNNWIVKSQKNKAKVKSFKLEHKRSCTIQVYPNGKVIVALECSYRPFKLNEEDGCREFFGIVGKVELILSHQFGQFSIIPPAGEWLLKEYDRDVTIPESDPLKKYPQIKRWYSKEGIQIKALDRIFQIYGKIMPICGMCLRLEEKVGIKNDVQLEQGIKEAIDQPFEIASAFDLLENIKESGKGSKV
jgi:hypothetical protein